MSKGFFYDWGLGSVMGPAIHEGKDCSHYAEKISVVRAGEHLETV